MIYFYCTSWQFFQMIVKWRISPTTEQIMFTFSILLFHFYSHIPYGMWRIPKLKHFVLLRFLLTHPVWDVTFFCCACWRWEKISTHTSRVGCDSIILMLLSPEKGFLLTHPVWDVTKGFFTSSLAWTFLLTHPVWDVTIAIWRINRYRNFYSHIPCGMWQAGDVLYYADKNFYSHIPCGMWLKCPLYAATYH